MKSLYAITNAKLIILFETNKFMITFSQHVPKKDKIGLSLYNRTFACTEVIVVKEVITLFGRSGS